MSDEEFLQEFEIYGRVMMIKVHRLRSKEELPLDSDEVKERILRMARCALPLKIEPTPGASGREGE